MRQDGTAWAWGYNRYGQLGDGSTIRRTEPVPVQGLTGVMSIAAGENHALATASCGLSVQASGTTQLWLGGTATFAASAGQSGCAGSITHDWDFGDGSAHSSNLNTTHDYASSGSYTWRFTAANGETEAGQYGYISVCEFSVNGTASHDTGFVPLTVTMDAEVLQGGCSFPVTYDWDFGDETAHSDEPSPSHTYTSAGTYTWTLTATAEGQTRTDTGTITAVNPPVITSMRKLGSPFRINVMGSNLQQGIAVYINGRLWGDSSNKQLVKWKTEANIKIKKGSALKAQVPKYTDTTFRFVNPDGGETTVVWQWP